MASARPARQGATSADRAIGDRHIWGPRPIAALVPKLVRPAYKRRSPAAAQIIADWSTIVGPALSAVTVPRRLFSGTLTIACAGPVALELQHLSAALMQRINTHAGQPVVQHLRFVQDMMPGSAPIPTPAPDPQARRAAESAVAGLPDGPLRDALAGLGAAVLTHAAASRPVRRR